MTRRPSQARQILGVPFIPPARLTRALVSLRDALWRTHRRTAPPSMQVMEALFGLFDNRVLGLIVELGLPELLDRPRATADLAAVTGTDPDRLERFLRYAAGRGFVTFEGPGEFGPSEITRIVRRDHPNSWRGWVEMASSDWFWDSWRHLDAAVRGRRSAIEAATGHDFFEFANKIRPEAGDAFNRAMAAGATVQAVALDNALDWSGVTVVCDVGGGTGAVLEYLLSARPHLQGVLFDLPEVVATARPSLTSGPLAGRCRLVPGSFFDEVPAGAQRYLLLAIVHDWDDDEAARLLGRVGEALGPDGRAVVVEGVLPERPGPGFIQASDLLMQVFATGRERTAAQFDELYAKAGLTVTRRVGLLTGYTAFELARR
jgi:O-methyltransferase